MRGAAARAAAPTGRRPVPWLREAPDPARIPPLLRLLGVTALLAWFGPYSVAGFRLSGWSWVLALALGAAVLVQRARYVAFPWALWAPWGLMLGVRLAASDFDALQRTLQIVTPLVVGAAVSTLRPGGALLDRLVRLAHPALLLLAGLLVVRSGLLLSGVVPDVTGFAAESMTVTLLAVLYAVEVHGGDRRSLRWWLGAVATTLFTVTRTTILATVLTLPASLARVRAGRRLAIVAVAALVGLAVFSTDRVQRKTFASGQGRVEDLLGEDFRDSGRFAMWQAFRARIAERPGLGWGAGAGQAYARQITAGQLAYPHNDWLQNTFDYGYAGSALYAVTMLAATLHALRRAKRAEGSARTLLVAGASCFPVYALLMYGDNAMTYGGYFGNYHFAALGLAYGALAAAAGGEEPPS